MKKKLTALLLVCAMAIPYGTMPVYADNLAETESSEEQEMLWEEETIQKGEAIQEEEVQILEARTGGSINWDYPDNIIPTDKETAGDGCLLAGVQGTYLADAQNALNLINQYRKEACENGYPDPRNENRKLTASDYTPIKWSSDLEYIARIRAAEASVLTDHTRPNGELCFSLKSPNNIGSYGEVLAWNYSKSMLNGIEQWYDEKQDWLDQNSDAVTGHYTQMIDPDNTYVGIAAFLNENGVYPNTTSGEFTSQTDLDEEKAPVIENCTQIIEVQKSDVTASITGLAEVVEAGYAAQAVLQLTDNKCTLQYVSDITGAAPIWSSNNESAVTVDQNGNVKAVGNGQAVISVTSDCGFSASYTMTVSNQTKEITESDVKIGNLIYTGSEAKPSVTVVHDDQTLQEGTDYTWTYSSAINAGDMVYVTVSGQGNYTGEVTKSEMIQSKSIETNHTEITIGECDYTNESQIRDAITVKCDDLTLVQMTDYDVKSIQTEDKDTTVTIHVVIEGVGNYHGTVEKELNVTKKEKEKLSDADVIVGDIFYTSYGVYPSVTVVHDGQTLQEGTDYTCTYSDQAIDAGDTVTVTVEGINSYSGTVTKTVTMQQKNLENTAEISLRKCDYSNKEDVKNAVKVMDGEVILSEDRDYQITSLNTTKQGTDRVVEVTIEGIGNYCGTIQKTFTQTAAGGNINWDYPDNIIPTDKETAGDGCLLAGVQGTYLADAQNALDLINQYRKEACENGYPDPRDSDRKLTPSDYVPIEWSSDLEYIARIRAAESSTIVSHTRPNGESCFSITSPNNIESYGEVLAWNFSDSMLEGIEQWYDEKQDWLDRKSDAVTGHYTQMISPANTYVGIAAFLNENGVYPNTTSGEFTSDTTNLNGDMAPAIENCTQIIEVQKSNVTPAINGLEGTMEVDETAQALYQLVYNDCILQYIPDVTGGTFTWSSSDPSIASVDQNGNVTAIAPGTVTISVKTDCGLDAAYTLTVSNKTFELTEDNITIGHYTYTGSAIQPTVTVRYGDTVLKSGQDYTYTYTSATDAGETITVTVEGMNAYKGTVTKEVQVQPQKLNADKVDIDIMDCDFTDVYEIVDALVVKYDGKVLVQNTDYYVDTLQTSDDGQTAKINMTLEGCGNYTGTIKRSIKKTLPSKPVINKVDAKCVSDGLNITWQASGTVSGYDIFKSRYKNGQWEDWKWVAEITNAGTTKWKDQDVDSSTRYRYTVIGYNAVGMGDYVNKNVVETYFVPKPTTKLANGASGVTVSWSKSKNASGYYIYRKEKKSDSWVKVKTVDSKTASWTDTSTKAGKSYYYTIVAYRDKSRSAFDSECSIIRLERPAVSTANASKGVKISWKKIAGVQTYDVYRSQYSNNAWSKWTKVASVKNDTFSYIDTTVKEAKTYKYTVRAVNGKSQSAYESGKSLYRMSQPDFTISSISKGISVKVKANKNIDGYWIYKKDSKGKWQKVATVKANKASTWTDTNVKKNKKYTYTVRAYKKKDVSSYHAGKTVVYKGGK